MLGGGVQSGAARTPLLLLPVSVFRGPQALCRSWKQKRESCLGVSWSFFLVRQFHSYHGETRTLGAATSAFVYVCVFKQENSISDSWHKDLATGATGLAGTHGRASTPGTGCSLSSGCGQWRRPCTHGAVPWLPGTVYLQSAG